MGDLNADILAAATRRYAGLRRRFWGFWLGFIVVWGVGALSISLANVPRLRPVIGYIVVGLVVPGALACWVGGIATILALRLFRCPRCGDRFTLVWYSSWPTDRCKHCELDLGATAKPTAKKIHARPEPTSSGAEIWDREFDGNP